MLFINTYKRHKKVKQLSAIFEPSYEIKKNFKISKHTLCMLFPKYRLAVEFGEYDNSSKRTIELEKAGLRIFNVPDMECIFQTAGRLLYIINNSK